MFIYFCILIAIVFFIYIIIHLRPLNEEEIFSLAQKRRNNDIYKYYSFEKYEVYPDVNFKKKMKPEGQYKEISVDLNRFPSYVAALLKYKKHEWILVGFEKNSLVNLIWLNKGDDNKSTYLKMPFIYIAEKAKDNNYTTLLMFHNHPNSNPNQYSCTTPSETDLCSFKSFSDALNRNGINFIDFVCERGRHYEYGFSIHNNFLNIDDFSNTVREENNKSLSSNYKLHQERIFSKENKRQQIKKNGSGCLKGCLISISIFTILIIIMYNIM